MALKEPQSAADYTDRATTAVKSVLVEIGQVLGSFRGKFAIIGGAEQLGDQRPPAAPSGLRRFGGGTSA